MWAFFHSYRWEGKMQTSERYTSLNTARWFKKIWDQILQISVKLQYQSNSPFIFDLDQGEVNVKRLFTSQNHLCADLIGNTAPDGRCYISLRQKLNQVKLFFPHTSAPHYQQSVLTDMNERAVFLLHSAYVHLGFLFLSWIQLDCDNSRKTKKSQTSSFYPWNI